MSSERRKSEREEGQGQIEISQRRTQNINYEKTVWQHLNIVLVSNLNEHRERNRERNESNVGQHLNAVLVNNLWEQFCYYYTPPPLPRHVRCNGFVHSNGSVSRCSPDRLTTCVEFMNMKSIVLSPFDLTSFRSK